MAGRRSTSLAPLIAVAIVTVLSTVMLLVNQGQEQGLGPGPAALEATSVDPDSLPVTVPFDHVDGHIVLDVALPDGTVTPMVLDSGAPTIISPELATSALSDAQDGLGAVGTIETTSLDGRPTTSDVVTLPQLRIGEAEFRDVGAVVGLDATDRGNPLACLTDAGFIGASLMKEAVWQIDYGALELTIAPDVTGLDHVEGAIHLAFERASAASPSPIVRIGAGDATLRLLVDTGSNGWLATHPHDLRDSGIEVEAEAPAILRLGAGAAGPILARLAFVAADVRLGEGDRLLEGLPLAVTEVMPEGMGNLGGELLAHFVVTIDWIHDVLYLDPVSPDPRPGDPLSASVTWQDGYVLGSSADGFGIDGTPASDQLAPGTRVVAIDGEDVTDATFDEFCARSRDAQGRITSITLATDPATTLGVAPLEGFFERLEG